MEINNLKEWIDKGFVLRNKNNNNYTLTIRKQADDNYRFFYGVTIEDSERISEKDWGVFVHKVSEFLEKNGVEL